MKKFSLYLSFLGREFLKRRTLNSYDYNKNLLANKLFSTDKKLLELYDTDFDDLFFLYKIKELIDFQKKSVTVKDDSFESMQKRLYLNDVFAKRNTFSEEINKKLINDSFFSKDKIASCFFFENLNFFIYDEKSVNDAESVFSKIALKYKREEIEKNAEIILDFFKNYIFYRSLKEKGILKDFIESLNQAIENEKKIESGVEVYLQNGDFLLKYFDYIDNPVEENKRAYIESLKKLSRLYASNRDFGDYSVIGFFAKKNGVKYLKYIFETIKFLIEGGLDLKKMFEGTSYQIQDSVIEQIKVFLNKVAKRPFTIHFDEEIEKSDSLNRFTALKKGKNDFNRFIDDLSSLKNFEKILDFCFQFIFDYSLLTSPHATDIPQAICFSTHNKNEPH